MLFLSVISFSHYYSYLSWVLSRILLFTRRCYRNYFSWSPFFAVSYDRIIEEKIVDIQSNIFHLGIELRVDANGAKICYQCDELHPSSKWKFWGEKITKCSGVPFEKFATKTSKAFGAAVLTCYTVIHTFDQYPKFQSRSFSSRNSMIKVLSSNEVHMDSVKPSTRTSNAVIDITYAADQACAINTILLLAHHHVMPHKSIIEEKQICPFSL